MEQNDPLPQIEHGTLVALSCNGLYLSPEHISHDRQKPEAKAFVRGGKQDWEVFRVIKHLGETSKVSFQNVKASTYLSAADHWKFVGHDQDWEQFELDLVDLDLSAPVTFCIRAGSGPKKNHYLAPAASAENSCAYSSERILWRLDIVGVPTIYLGPRSKNASQALAGSGLADLKGQKNHLNILLKIARAHKDVGFFYVTGHAIKLDLFRIIRDTKDPLPWRSWQNDEETDRHGKVGVELAQYRYSTYNINKNGWSQQMKGISNIDSTVKEFYEDINSLSLDLLHYLALAEQHVTNQPASWREEFLSEQRFLNMRSLVYHPGPAGAVTTTRHTDATWLTLLLQDNVGGLQIMSRDNTFIDVPPLDGAILVNTGNVLQHRSNGHFKAVCHRVVRPEATADRTRYSLMFFYDHEGGSTNGC